jgi:glutathione S-transferase
MKLYYAPATCSLAVHIAAREAAVPLQLIKVNLTTHQLEGGADFYAINPRGYVPVLELNDGQQLTETAVLLQYIADLNPACGLIPVAGTMDRVYLQTWLTFISTELHKAFGPLWHKETPQLTRQHVQGLLAKRFAELERVLAKQPYLMGQRFTVADAYAFAIMNWCNMLSISLAPYPGIVAMMDRVAKRPAVIQAMQTEGLLKAAA